MAHPINIANDTLEDEVEPYLLRTGLVIRTPRGRRVTEAGYAHLGWEMPKPGESGQRKLF